MQGEGEGRPRVGRLGRRRNRGIGDELLLNSTYEKVRFTAGYSMLPHDEERRKANKRAKEETARREREADRRQRDEAR